MPPASSPTLAPAARPSPPSSCPPKRKRASSVGGDIDDRDVDCGSEQDVVNHEVGRRGANDTDQHLLDEEGRSACRALLSWHRNGDGPLCLEDSEDGGSRHNDSDSDVSPAVSILAEHLRGLGFRVGKSLAQSSSSSSLGASNSTMSVSVYRDSMSSSPVIAEAVPTSKADRPQQPTSFDCGRGDFWRVLLGVHPNQSDLESSYRRRGFRDGYCRLLLLELLRSWLVEDNHKSAEEKAIGSVPNALADTDTVVLPCRPQLERVDSLIAQCLDGLSVTLSNVGALLCTAGATPRQCRFDKYDVDGSSSDSDDGSSNFIHGLHEEIFAGCEMTTPRWTEDQMRAEHGRIRARNSTLSNAYLQLWQRRAAQCLRRRPQQPRRSTPPPDLRLSRIDYHASPNPKFERFKLFIVSSPHGHSPHRPSQDATLTLLPCLARIVNRGVEDTARHLVECFWDYLEQECHYHSTPDLRALLSPSLGKFFASGLSTGSALACLSLEAKFLPMYPFSLYLHGEPGTGKSSVVRHVGRAIRHVLNEHVDPSLTRLDTVKQMLNKPSAELELDLELRRNNNDLSLSSLLLSRRQRSRASGTSEPTAGLVVLALEELAPPAPTKPEKVCFAEVDANGDQSSDAPDPNQHGTLTLLTQRLSGRSGAHSLESHVRANGVARSGISGDPSIVTVITSNYSLTDASLDLLRELPLFENIALIPMEAMVGEDRQAFADSYLDRCVHQQLRRRDLYTQLSRFVSKQCCINFVLPEVHRRGDVRPLVRMLRMLAYYIATQMSLFASSAKADVHVVSRTTERCAIHLESEQTKITWEILTSPASGLLLASMDHTSGSYPQTTQVQDAIRLLSIQNGFPCAELSILFEFWLSGALAPAVILSTRDNPYESLLSILSNVDEVHVLRAIDASSYRMMRSLYDPIDTPNLRDDIRRLGKDKPVAVEIVCPDVASQLCIREMIEDTPSMTAYSSHGSALHKEGLMFFVRIKGVDITPEVRSRASLIL